MAYDPSQALSATGYTIARLLEILTEELTNRQGRVWGIPIHLTNNALNTRIDFAAGNHRNIPAGTPVNFPSGAVIDLEIVNMGPGHLYYGVNVMGDATALLPAGKMKQFPDTKLPKYQSINLRAAGDDVDCVINVGV
jgi:urease beta subunit